MTDQPLGGRGAIETGFSVIEAVVRAPGVGVSELSRMTGLPKSTVFRVLRQLLASGALERAADGYYIGPQVAGWGRQWRPHPALRRSSILPIRRLAEISRGWAGVFWQADDEACLVEQCCTAGVPFSVDVRSQMWHHTAAGRLLMVDVPGEPPGYTPHQWRLISDRIRADEMLAFDHQDLMGGVNCVAARVVPREMAGRAVVCAIYFSPQLPNGAADEIQRAARAIERNWRTTTGFQ